ncbi:MAG: hypothetical protein ABH854_04730 [Candidatus Diapherotrites archaeon]|nr:hypothetical protein [Candidatus Micrarchaeota archaeon]MBU1939371.1 hypothetical protein [Candidatus Micrarchaeota archaeon]
MDEKYLKKLVLARLNASSPDISFSIGKYGDFTRDQLIREVEKGTDVGLAATEMELNFLRKLPKFAQMVE